MTQEKRKQKTIAIIGGGASGLAAAVTVARQGNAFPVPPRILLLERLDRVGKKLLATGNGRCNLSNRLADETGYFGSIEFARKVLRQFPVSSNLDFFASMGLLCKEESQGRIYPDCEQASAVLDVLRLEAAMRGVEEHTGCAVSRIEPRKGRFELVSSPGLFRADAVLVAAGGKASPKLGSDGSGFALLRQLGHTVTPLAPALVPLRSSSKYPRQLKGIRKKCRIVLEVDGQAAAEEEGEILFNDTGISGIASMQLARFVETAFQANPQARVAAAVNLLPRFSEQETHSFLAQNCRRAPGRPVRELMTGLFPRRLGMILLKQAGMEDLEQPLCSLSPEFLNKLSGLIGHWVLPLTGTLGFDHAQVTAGGADTGEFDPGTLESRRVPGLFAAGEVLDVDGDCGGYNLQWAWSSGRAAGEGILNYLKQGGDAVASDQ